MKSLKLYNSLILSDFSLIDIKKKPFHVSKTVSLNKKISINILNLPYLVSSLKQFLKVLTLLKTFKNSTLEIVVINKQHYYLLKEYFKDKIANYALNLNFIPSISYSQKKSQSGLKLTMILDSNGILNESVGLKRFVMDSNFFIQTINSKFESQNQGFYKIFNDLNDFKKILYLSILIEKTLK